MVLSKRARARAVQLPAWNEALGLPRPWDQQWSLRLQQILAYETDLLEHDDLFDGAPVVEAKVQALAGEARGARRIEAMGGALAAVESGYMKQRLVESNGAGSPRSPPARSPWSGSTASPRRRPHRWPPARTVSRDRWRGRSRADRARAGASGDARRRRGGARSRTCSGGEGRNVMPPPIACARSGVTTGEWAETLRKVFGDYRAPTG